MKTTLRILGVILVFVLLVVLGMNWYSAHMTNRYVYNMMCTDYLDGVKNFREADKLGGTERFKSVTAGAASILYAEFTTGIPNAIFDEALMVKSMNELNSICHRYPEFRIGALFEQDLSLNMSDTYGLRKTLKDMLAQIEVREDASVTALAKFIHGTYAQAQKYQEGEHPNTFTPLDASPTSPQHVSSTVTPSPTLFQ